MKTFSHIGKLPPRYGFILNPYNNERFSKCPMCNNSMHGRKFALFIHIDNAGGVVLGKTCKYCSKCELIVAHKNELDDLLAKLFSTMNPRVIGNDYVVMGTVDLKFWQSGKTKATSTGETLEYTAGIKTYYDIECRPAGWYPAESP